MRRLIVLIGILGAAAVFYALHDKNIKTEAYIDGDVVFVRSDFGPNRCLIRKIDLRSQGRGNEVINFAGARIVYAFGDVPFDRGYSVSEEYDDAAPLRFNGTYIGGNHGAAFAVRVPVSEHLQVGSRWIDSEGTPYKVIAADDHSTTFLSDELGNPGSWRFKTTIKGFLSEVSGDRLIPVSQQELAQVFPSVRRISVSVDSGPDSKLGKHYIEVPKLLINEVYEILSPASSEAVAKVSITYTFKGSDTIVESNVEAYQDIRDFSMAATQASPINYKHTDLQQQVGQGEWANVTDSSKDERLPGEQSSQRISWSSFKFGQTVAVDSVKINDKPINSAGLVEVSAAKKQYPLALVGGVGGFDGTLRAGDKVSVVARRAYWPGEEP